MARRYPSILQSGVNYPSINDVGLSFQFSFRRLAPRNALAGTDDIGLVDIGRTTP